MPGTSISGRSHKNLGAAIAGVDLVAATTSGRTELEHRVGEQHDASDRPCELDARTRGSAAELFGQTALEDRRRGNVA